MRGYRPGGFGEADPSQADVLPADLLQEDRARRIPCYAQRAANGEPLFEGLESVTVPPDGSPEAMAVPA